MEQEIGIGDVVCLKSDRISKYLFTVGFIKERQARCWFINRDGSPQAEMISLGALQIVTKGM